MPLEGDDQFWWSGRGASAGCHCSVLWFGGEGDDQFWWSGRVAIAGCHCSVLWLRGRVTTNFGGVDVVPLLRHCGSGEGDDQVWGSGRGAIAGCPYAAMASRQTDLIFL